MRFGLISCVHANLPALEAVLKDAERQGCDTLICLGDIVGYYDYPKECLDLIRSRCRLSVKGNHDEYASTSDPLEGFNPRAVAAMEWTRGQLSPMDRTWLADLPLSADVEGFTIVHASLASPERWPYVFDRLAAAEHFTHQSLPLCFNGHTHIPIAFEYRKGVVKGGTYTQFTADPGVRYLVNVGSVGQPRDGRVDASYAVYDATIRTVELRRVDYPRPPSGGHGARRPVGGGGGPPKKLQAHSDYADDED
jgi:predicted phosphodiesterase